MSTSRRSKEYSKDGPSVDSSGRSSYKPRPEQFEDDHLDEDDQQSNSSFSDGSESNSDGSSYESSYESDLNSSKVAAKQTLNIAKRETNRVQAWRTVLSIMLLVTGGIVIVTTYMFLAENETSEFKSAVRFLLSYSATWCISIDGSCIAKRIGNPASFIFSHLTSCMFLINLNTLLTHNNSSNKRHWPCPIRCSSTMSRWLIPWPAVQNLLHL